jgi:hypothetical protein
VVIGYVGSSLSLSHLATLICIFKILLSKLVITLFILKTGCVLGLSILTRWAQMTILVIVKQVLNLGRLSCDLDWCDLLDDPLFNLGLTFDLV